MPNLVRRPATISAIGLFILSISAIHGGSAADEKSPAVLEVKLNYSEVPEMKEWAEQSSVVLKKQYPMIVEALHVEGYTPPNRISVTFKKDMKGVAYTAGTRIVCAAPWFTAHKDDVGALVHELAHVVQSYPKYDPPWLVEGVADYVRWWRYEEPKNRHLPNPDRSNYSDGYQTTGAFLAWVVTKYDKELVLKVNEALRDGNYKPQIFKESTGKSVEDLWTEFKSTLPPRQKLRSKK